MRMKMYGLIFSALLLAKISGMQNGLLFSIMENTSVEGEPIFSVENTGNTRNSYKTCIKRYRKFYHNKFFTYSSIDSLSFTQILIKTMSKHFHKKSSEIVKDLNTKSAYYWLFATTET